MTYEISPDRHRLTIKADSNERAELSRQSESPGIQSDEAMHDWFESMVCNSELDWIADGETGDLTSAPMLGILGRDRAGKVMMRDARPYGWRHAGSDGKKQFYQPILDRWAFADYQVRSILEVLRDRGEVVFVDSF